MGGQISKLNHSRWFGKNHRRVLCLGLNGSGKSTLTGIFTSSFKRASKPLPEIGCYKFKAGKYIVSFYDLKGDSQSRYMWRHHFEGSQGIVFVVDLSTFEENKEENAGILNSLMTDELLPDSPFLVICNKKDIAVRYDDAEIAHALDLENKPKDRWALFQVCAISGEGTKEAIDWLLNKMSPV